MATHLRDELGISEVNIARPIQAALTSAAATFAIGAALPLLVVVIAPLPQLASTVMGTSLLFLALLGIFQLILVVHGLASVLNVLSFGEHWQWH